MNLFIIGNGFDLNEGLATSYADFKIYLEKNNPSLLDDLGLFYNGIIDSEINPTIIDFDISYLIKTNGEMFYIIILNCGLLLKQIWEMSRSLI